MTATDPGGCECTEACPYGNARYYQILISGITNGTCGDCDEFS